ncbi:hypothetical protein Vi05172_g9483 [Venturia inaequalis]|nr:hypothetical protein Vi05172_g9483 [Venturia inaequalis]
MHLTSFILGASLSSLTTAMAIQSIAEAVAIALAQTPSPGNPSIRLSWDVNQLGMPLELKTFTYESCNDIPIDKKPYLGKPPVSIRVMRDMCKFYPKDGCQGEGVKMGSWTPGEDGGTSRLKNVVPKIEAVRSVRCVFVPMRTGLTTQPWYAEFIDGSVVGSLDNVICKAQESCVP